MNFVTSVRPSVLREQLGFHWADFHDILYFNIFFRKKKCREKMKVLVKVAQNKGYFT